ncbi:dicarboxylate/amino acid:cation symporter [Yunchengibacter salinarum]|uniref:dicarboxylate/amino acid:cation symporter n=1 Tax=Yunchengibacter salinarum TaxID=3133399 RepID=UPI0035B572D1
MSDKGTVYDEGPGQGLLRHQLWFRVLVGLLAGFAGGLLLGPEVGLVADGTGKLIGEWLALPGNIFLTVLQFIVIPLVVASVMLGIADGNDSRAIGTLGGGVLWFVITTTIAITIAFILSNLIEPGSQIDSSRLGGLGNPDVDAPDLTGRSIPATIASALPENMFEHMASNDMLQIVIAAAIFGLALIRMPNVEGQPIIDLMRATQSVCMTVVLWLMKFAPIVVFGLIADTVITKGLSAIAAVSMFFFTVILALLAMIGVYMLLVAVLGGRNPITFIKDCREPMLLAFSTSSSSATMPVTLRTTTARHKVRTSVGGLVIPLGTTINMDGTALYQAVAATFIAQAYGLDLTTFQMVSIVVLAIAGSIGTPGIPSAGIPILAAILENQGIPVEGIALILGVDRLLDMSRTVINVTGDMTAATVLDRLIGHKLDKKAPEAVAETPPSASG